MINSPRLFGVGWMHLLGMLCVIFFFELVVVYFVVWGYPIVKVLILAAVASGIASPLVWNWIDRLAEKNEAERTRLLKQ